MENQNPGVICVAHRYMYGLLRGVRALHAVLQARCCDNLTSFNDFADMKGINRKKKAYGKTAPSPGMRVSKTHEDKGWMLIPSE